MAARCAFETAAAFRRWLEQHHDRERELTLIFYKKGSGTPSLTYSEALDQALCFGWIDGVRKSVDAARYSIRFTPRTPASNWSAVNRRRVADLETLGLMHPAGKKAFDERTERRSQRYSYENRPRRFNAPLIRVFRADKAAWTFFTAQPPGYQRKLVWWVMSAVKEETSLKRLAVLIEASATGRRLG